MISFLTLQLRINFRLPYKYVYVYMHVPVSEVGGENRSMRSPTGNPSPAPSTRTARIARTTRQINGAKPSGGCVAGRRIFLLTSNVTKKCPESPASCGEKKVHFGKGNRWFHGEQGKTKFESLSKSNGFVNFMIIQYFKMLMKLKDFQSFCNFFLWSWRVNVRVTL